MKMERSNALLIRRALLQSVKADEKLIEQLNEIIQELEPDPVILWQDGTRMGLVKTVKQLKLNADERRKAYLQLVRGIEKANDIRSYNATRTAYQERNAVKSKKRKEIREYEKLQK